MPKCKRKPYFDQSGKRYGKLMVLWAAGWRPEGKNSRIVWSCQCDCGKITVAYITDLKRERTKSCGCGKVVHHNPNAMELFSQYKQKAKSRGYSWDLSFDKFLQLTSSNCYYTGWKPNQIRDKFKNHEPYIWNGIDRVDNNEGYSIINCVPCNGDVNKAKLGMTKENFLEMCKAIVKTQEIQVWD